MLLAELSCNETWNCERHSNQEHRGQFVICSDNNSDTNNVPNCSILAEKYQIFVDKLEL